MTSVLPEPIIPNILPNNMNSDKWGSYGWKFLHTVSFGYPDNPTDEDKKNYKSFFEILRYTLPCTGCRESYAKHITILPLTDQVMANSHNLSLWLYNIHNLVNKSKEVSFNLSYEEVKEYYNSMKIKCNEPAIPSAKSVVCKKSQSLQLSQNNPININEYHIIPYDIAIKFSRYAIIRGYKDFNNIIEKYKNYSELKNTILWKKRNAYIKDILSSNNFPLLETEEPYTNLPTQSELLLISLLHSRICVSKLKEILELLTEDKLNKLDELNKSKELTKPKKYKFVILTY